MMVTSAATTYTYIQKITKHLCFLGVPLVVQSKHSEVLWFYKL